MLIFSTLLLIFESGGLNTYSEVTLTDNITFTEDYTYVVFSMDPLRNQEVIQGNSVRNIDGNTRIVSFNQSTTISNGAGADVKLGIWTLGQQTCSLISYSFGRSVSIKYGPVTKRGGRMCNVPIVLKGTAVKSKMTGGGSQIDCMGNVTKGTRFTEPFIQRFDTTTSSSRMVKMSVKVDSSGYKSCEIGLVPMIHNGDYLSFVADVPYQILCRREFSVFEIVLIALCGVVIVCSCVVLTFVIWFPNSIVTRGLKKLCCGSNKQEYEQQLNQDL